MKDKENCFLKVKKNYLKFLRKERINNKLKINSLKNFYIPLSFWIEKKYRKSKKTLFLGFSGGQGVGKTTTTDIIKIILEKYFKRKIFKISIDDFYKTMKDRKNMSKKIHPLFNTRGVPGTHDTDLIMKFLTDVKKKNFKKIKIPKFSKKLDDRLKKKYWFKLKEKPEIVILEGWCIGAKSQNKKLIKKPINFLEKVEDKNMIWRNYANERLKNEYKKIFRKIDHFIFMRVPSFKMVLKWRSLQEEKLKKKSHLNKKIMSYNAIKRFIMFYERITLQMIKDLSKSASVVIFLKKNHEIKNFLIR